MSKFVVGATWDDVPHLSAEQKAELWGSILPYQRDARAKGIPELGSGAIRPVGTSWRDARLPASELRLGRPAIAV